MKNFRFFFLVFVSLSFFSCQTSLKSGLQKDYGFYLAAQIAFFPILSLSEDKSLNQTLDPLLKNFSGEILQDFKYQDHIDGFGPDLVTELLQKKNSLPLLTELKNHLRVCSKNPQKFIPCYKENLKEKPEWLLTLSKLSKGTKASDAFFFPLLLRAEEKHTNDRGLQISRRNLEAVFLLIESDNGEIVWFEPKRSSLSHKHLMQAPDFKYPAYPPWKNFEKKLIVKALWKDFPGWQY